MIAVPRRLGRIVTHTGLATLLVASVVTGVVATATPATAGTVNAAKEPAPRKLVSGWMPYWTPDTSLASFRANADLFSDVTGFWHTSTGASTIVDQLSDAQRAAIVNAVHAKGVRIIGAVTDGTAARKMSRILKDKTRRTAHVKALVSLAVSNHYDGIDLDYEKFAFYDGSSTWANTRPAWVAFVKQLSKALHARGLWLTASVPVMYNSNRDSSSGYWVYDYKNIAPYVDRLRIMTYDYSVSRPGPIGPIAWVRRVLDYATSQVPAGKIQVGVPAYGRDWPTTTDGCPVDNMPTTTSYTSSAVEQLARDKGITPTWDGTNAEKTFSYNKTYAGLNKNGNPTTCKVKRTVWFQEATATKRRAQLVGEYKLGGIAQWTIGGEDPAQWKRLRDYALSIAKTSPKVELFAGDMVRGGSVKVHATVRTASGKPIVGEDWVLYRRGINSSKWNNAAHGTTDAKGAMARTRSPKKTSYWKLWVGGSWYRYSATTQPNRTLVKPKSSAQSASTSTSTSASTTASTSKLQVGASFSKATLDLTDTVTLSGTVAPKVAGLTVKRQRLISTGWVTVGTTTSTANGRYSMKVVPTEKGFYTYRVRVSGAVHHRNGTSHTLHFTVR